MTAKQERQVSYIRRSAESLTKLVNDLLDLAKLEAGKLEIRPFTISELFGALRGVMKPLQQNDTLELIFEEPDCPALFTDEAKVAQILRNLISNSLKFTERGEVRVAAATFDNQTRQCSLEVADTGIGIGPEDHELVFQESAQVANLLQFSAKGTGLGQPLSHRLAELLGGSLTVRSTPGMESAFVLCIPSALGQAAAQPPVVVSQPRQQRSVLVIDDEENLPLRHTPNTRRLWSTAGP